MVAESTYAAAIAALVYRERFRGDVNNRVEYASPESAIWLRAYAPRRSNAVKTMFVANGNFCESGSSEKRGRSIGAWWKTPPSYGETLWV
jgi:hypothetical protein